MLKIVRGGPPIEQTQLMGTRERVSSEAAPGLWKALPQEVSLAPALSFFHRHLKTHLFRQAFNNHDRVLKCLVKVTIISNVYLLLNI